MPLPIPACRERSVPATTQELRTLLEQVDTTVCDAVAAGQCEQLRQILTGGSNDVLQYPVRQQVRAFMQHAGIPFAERDEAGIHPHARRMEGEA